MNEFYPSYYTRVIFGSSFPSYSPLAIASPFPKLCIDSLAPSSKIIYFIIEDAKFQLQSKLGT